MAKKTKTPPELLEVWLLDPDTAVTKTIGNTTTVTANMTPLGIQVQMPHPRRWNFNPGKLIITKAAYAKYKDQMIALFQEHLKGNFRDTDPEARAENQAGARKGTSIYDMAAEPCIVTYCEHDCTMMLWGEY
jgi:hypothetical protein